MAIGGRKPKQQVIWVAHCWRGDKDSCREFHANRHRCRSNEGKRLSRLRSWPVERSFAFLKRSGNPGRVTLRGMDNVAKRYMTHAVGHNLALTMRHLDGNGTPKGAADAIRRALTLLWRSILSMLASLPPLWRWEDETFSFPIWPCLRQGHVRVS